MADQAKMSYNAALFRVRCEFTRALCLESEAPPADLLTRAKIKLESVKAKGEVAFFNVFETRLSETWQALRNATDEPSDRRIQITLAAGAPMLLGVKVEAATADKALAMLTLDATLEVAQSWRWEWFKLVIAKRMRELGVKEQPSPAQIYSAFLRARLGEKVSQVALSAVPGPGAGPAKAFSVIANKQRMEIGVVIRNVGELHSPQNRDAMLLLIQQAVKQLSVDGVEYRIIKKDFTAALQSALDGVEDLGIDMPLVLLAAIGQSRQAGSGTAGGRIVFDISKDKIEAVINGFRKDYYDDKDDPVTVDWIRAELKRRGITAQIKDELAKELSDAIAAKEDLNGKVACRANPGTAGSEPFLHPSYKDAESRGADLDKANLNIRDLQQREVVKSGQLVAEVRFKTPPSPGRNLFGEETPPPPGEELALTIGEGIQLRGNGRYFASCDGIPEMSEDALSLSKVLVHQGDVNLRTGNIYFDGPVEITGNVDSGAVVEATGDIVIHGSVAGGTVRSFGSIQIGAGVTTGERGQVQARNDIAAEFIENSVIICGGNLKVTKALLNSQSYVGGTIDVSGKGGVTAGGRISCRQSLVTENLGYKMGALTVLNIGADWRMARRIDIRQLRLEKLQKRSNEDRQALRELVQKTKAQLTTRHKELKEEMQNRLVRLRTICERLEAGVATATQAMTYNPDSRLIVVDQLVANVSLTLSGQNIAVVNSVANVAVLAKRRRGSFIVPLEEIEAEEKETRDAASALGRAS